MIAVTMVRDEADIIGYTVAQLLAQPVRQIVVADNCSTDTTREVLAALDDDRVKVVDDGDGGYWQARKMTMLARVYAEPGEWVVPFDADELWAGLDRLPDDPNVRIATAGPYVHVPSPGDDPGDPNPITRIRRRQEAPETFPKVAFRAGPTATLGQGNHQVSGCGDTAMSGLLDVRHFQYRTLEQTARKVRQGAAALALTDLPASSGSHWRRLAAMSDLELARWWESYITQPTVEDPAPYLCHR